MVKILTANNDPRFFSYDLMIQTAIFMSTKLNPILPFLCYSVGLISHYLWALMLVSQKRVDKENVVQRNPFRSYIIGFFALTFSLYIFFTLVGIFMFDLDLMSLLLQLFAAGKISLDATCALYFFRTKEVEGRPGTFMSVCFLAGTVLSYRVPWNLFTTVNMFKFIAHSAKEL